MKPLRLQESLRRIDKTAELNAVKVGALIASSVAASVPIVDVSSASAIHKILAGAEYVRRASGE